MTEEDFENLNNRLVEAEGQIFALTRLLREILPMVVDARFGRELSSEECSEAMNTSLKQMQEACVVKDDTEIEWAKFLHAAHALFGGLIKGALPSRPTSLRRPTLTVFKGDKE
jgi:hypothetical protein